VIDDHERIEELLAGYALLALDGEDAAEADRLLAEHVPSCLTCRTRLAEFQELTGDLGLAAPLAPVPDLLLPRIHRAMNLPSLPFAGSRRPAMLAVAASVVALVVMGGMSLTMAGRVDRAEQKAEDALGAATLAGSTVPLSPLGSDAEGSLVVDIPESDVRTIYLASQECPEPAPGRVYILWLGRDGDYVPYGEFAPDGSGHVILEVRVDVALFDEILVTEEIDGARPEEPNVDGERTWHAVLVPAEDAGA